MNAIVQATPAKPARAVAKAKASPIAKTVDVKSETESLMSAIIQIAPAGDIGMIERLKALYDEIEARNAKRAFISAMADMQPRLPVITQRGRILMREKGSDGKTRDGAVIQNTGFAKFEDIIETITPLLGEHGFTLNFMPSTAPDGKVRCTAILGHRDGHEKEAFLDLVHDSTGSKNAIQSFSSSNSYAKRILTCSMLNIVSRGEDNDAQGSEDVQPITISAEQIHELQVMADERGADLAAFCKASKVASLADIVVKDFASAKALMARKKKVAA